MNQLYISKSNLTLIGDAVSEKEINVIKEMLGEKITNIVFQSDSGPSIMAKGLLNQEDISIVWKHYEEKGYLLRRIGDVGI